MKFIVYLLGIPICLFITFNIVESYNCMISLGTDHKWNNDGESGKCRPDAKPGSKPRLCLKYKTATKLGQIFRDCDHVYEKFFGYNTFRIDLGLGCRLFSAPTPDNGLEEGMYCYCYGNNCNSGDVPYPPRNTTTELVACGENLLGTMSCSYGTINILSGIYGWTSGAICPSLPKSTTSCSLDISDLLRQNCQGKSNCTINYGLGFAGTDPCVGTSKYSYAVYNCNWGL